MKGSQAKEGGWELLMGVRNNGKKKYVCERGRKRKVLGAGASTKLPARGDQGLSPLHWLPWPGCPLTLCPSAWFKLPAPRCLPKGRPTASTGKGGCKEQGWGLRIATACFLLWLCDMPSCWSVNGETAFFVHRCKDSNSCLLGAQGPNKR